MVNCSASVGVRSERLFRGCSRAHELPGGAAHSRECRRPSDTPASPHSRRLLRMRFAASPGTPPATGSFGPRDSWIARKSPREATGGRHLGLRRPPVVPAESSAQPAQTLVCAPSDPKGARQRSGANDVPNQIDGQIDQYFRPLRTFHLTSNFVLCTFYFPREAPCVET